MELLRKIQGGNIMNQYQAEHLKRKEEIMEWLKNAERFCEEELQNPDMLPEEKEEYEKVKKAITGQRENLEKDEFSIVLVGEFSAGKSTFLNALMGERLLPSFSSETTATINYLRHKEKAENGEAGHVYYEDGTRSIIEKADLKTIEKYVSTNGDNVASRVKYVELFLDNKLLENNVTLVDSPGLGGVAQGHAERTEDQIRKSSAGIFVFNAEQPGKATDFQVLDDLHKQLNSIICVLNKVDTIKESEGETVEGVIEKLKKNYKTAIPDADCIPEIYPASSGMALAARDKKNIVEFNGRTDFTGEECQRLEEKSGMKEFEDRLWRYLTHGERTKQALMAPVEQSIGLLTKLKALDKKTLEVIDGAKDVDDLEESRIQLEKQKDTMLSELENNTAEIKDKINNARREFMEKIDADGERFKERYCRQLDNWETLDDIEPAKINSDIEKGINKVYYDAMDDFRTEIMNIVMEYKNSEAEKLEEKFEAVDFKYTVENQFEKEEDVKLGIEKYQNEIKELKGQLQNLDHELEITEKDVFQVMEKNAEKERLEEKLKMKEKAKENYESMMLDQRPDVIRTTKEQVIEEDREGLIGQIKQFFVGKEKRIVEVPTVDDSERREHDREVKERTEKYNAEIEKIQKELDEIPVQNVQAVERKQHLMEEKRKQKQQEIEQANALFKEQAQKRIDKVVKQQKNAVQEFVDEETSSFKKKARKVIREQMDGLNQMINDIVAGELTAKINDKVKEIEILQKKAGDAVADKEGKKKVLDERIKALNDMLQNFVKMQDEIDDIVVDTIQKEEL